VQFYSNETCLCSTIATFLGEGFVKGQPAIVIATEAHTTAILEALVERFIDAPSARRAGDLVLLDAKSTLAALTVGGNPDETLLDRQVGDLIRQVLGGRTRTSVRVYGEMVDLLWKEGRADAAIRLEVLWNRLAERYAFSLLCGYSVGNFYKQTTQFQDICAQHTHVYGADSQGSRPEPRARLT